MTTEFFCNILPDIAGFTTSFVYAMIMIPLGLHLLKPGRHYPALVLSMGFIAVIEFCTSLYSTILELQGVDASFINFYIRPASLCLEQSMVLFSILYILYVGMRQLRPILYIFIAFLFVTFAFPLIYRCTLSPTQDFLDIENFRHFTDTTIAKVLRQAINLSMFILMFASLRCVMKGYRKFRSALEMFFSSDIANIRNKCILWALTGSAYTIMSVIAFCASLEWMKAVHRTVAIILPAIMLLIILCNEKQIIEIENAFHKIRRHSHSIADGSLSEMAESLLADKAQPEDVRRVRTIMEHWAQRHDRPYQQRGITLQSASEDMHLTKEVIQHYTDIIYGMSFRDWVLELRE